jgi:type III secretion protein U
LREARARGDVASSRALTGAAALLGGAAALGAAGPAIARDLAVFLRTSLAEATAGGAPPAAACARALAALARAAVAPCAGAALAAAAAGALQTRGLVAPRALWPDLGRLDPAKGLRRLASAERSVSAALGLAQAVAVLAAAWQLAVSGGPSIATAPRLPVAALLAALGPPALRLTLSLAAALAALGVLELALAARRRQRALRMTLEEVRRERRDEEGDPRHRAERRRLHRALAAAPPLERATCVVVNPTHLAVALRHDAGGDGAPVVLAKGAGLAAARLRARARRAGVPLVRDVALARALFRLAEVGDEIPEELYDAAAAVLVHLHGLAREGP